jgi:1,4-alpha-glucan branching enzyme
MKQLTLVALSWGLLLSSLLAQPVSVTPPFPTIEDSITLVYDALAGNGALGGVSPVHIHTGVITDQSVSLSDWQNVQTQWASADGLMESLGNDSHRIGFTIKDYYNLTPGTEVEYLACVFRDRDGNVVGRSSDGSDIYYPVYPVGSFQAAFLNAPEVLVVDPGEIIEGRAASSEASDLVVTLNGNPFAQALNDSVLDISYGTTVPGSYLFELTASNGAETRTDQIRVVVRGPVPQQPLPAGVEDGVNYHPGDTSVTLVLRAPQKEYAYLLADLNDYQPDPAYYLNQTPDGRFFWITLTGLTPGEEVGYQYLVDGTILIADPYAKKVLDPFNDPFLGDVYPNLKPYPFDQTGGIVSVLQTGQTPFPWQHLTYERPEQDELVIYELLVRDFVEDHSYQTVIDSLDYLQRLGVNAIELMPVMEFEGNISWGYNPSFFFAADKYYGTENDLRAFIDSCHGRGIVVLLDMVLNHAFGQNSMVRLYWDEINARPAPESPWFNPIPTHPFNVGYDFNHESDDTKYFVDRVLAHWVEDYHFDGYRMDLSKGFTQVDNLNDVGAWSAYDASRIALLNRMHDALLTVDPEVYFTLEHLSANNEEEELSDQGMMLWSNLNSTYNEATMGYNEGNKSDFRWIDYRNRGWSDANNIAYMESHDEERLMVRNYAFGNVRPGYSTKDESTALRRMEAAAAFYFPIPGPRMIWQFGELGYDVGIDVNGRTGPKPIRWEYYQEEDRRHLYDVYRSLIELRKTYPVMQTTDFTLQVSGDIKRVTLNPEAGDTRQVFIIGNFDIVPLTVVPGFPSTGTWYDFFGGATQAVTDLSAEATLAPGEFFIYSNEPLFAPATSREARDIYGVFTGVAPPVLDPSALLLAPNPSQGSLRVEVSMQRPSPLRIELLDLQGRLIETLQDAPHAAGTHQLDYSLGQRLSPGLYLVRVSTEAEVFTQKWLLKP